MSRQRTWFQIFAGAEVALVVLLAGTALTWNNGIALLERYQAGDNSVTRQQLHDIDSTVQLLAMLTIAAVVVRLVTLVGWLHSCVRLIADEHLGALSHSPGWSIGAWFVPFLNLVRVPRIFMDVQAAGETESRVLKDPTTIVLWWIAYICIALADRVLAATSTGTGIDSIRTLSRIATTSTMTQLLEAVITIPLLLGLTRALGRHLTASRAERARLAAYPAPTGAHDPAAYASYAAYATHPDGTSAPFGSPLPTPYASSAPSAPAPTWAPVAEPGSSVPTWTPPPQPGPSAPMWASPPVPGSSPPLPGFAPPPAFPPPSSNAYFPVLPVPPQPAQGTAPVQAVAPTAPGSAVHPQERVRILSDPEKAALAQVAPPAADAGWFVDPLHPEGQRYWNGTQWTGRTIAVAAAQAGAPGSASLAGPPTPEPPDVLPTTT